MAQISFGIGVSIADVERKHRRRASHIVVVHGFDSEQELAFWVMLMDLVNLVLDIEVREINPNFCGENYVGFRLTWVSENDRVDVLRGLCGRRSAYCGLKNGRRVQSTKNNDCLHHHNHRGENNGSSSRRNRGTEEEIQRNKAKTHGKNGQQKFGEAPTEAAALIFRRNRAKLKFSENVRLLSQQQQQQQQQQPQPTIRLVIFNSSSAPAASQFQYMVAAATTPTK
ncbi:hypothetical protein HAX54_002777 [Datura stramonium]|uniref:Uncharacterized protein n=1 Tax=Datura stramonium TaxID=4076 RepID=A0ABS8T5M6_DATST|nr:hypothetical protein [Datura stramonium]